MMEKLEKVIKGLECCVNGSRNVPLCEACPYGEGYMECRFVLHQDALELLKAQEPRVLEKDEMRDAFIVEYRPGKTNGVGEKLIGDNNDLWYGVYWRMWTSRPTQEQMEATPW